MEGNTDIYYQEEQRYGLEESDAPKQDEFQKRSWLMRWMVECSIRFASKGSMRTLVDKIVKVFEDDGFFEDVHNTTVWCPINCSPPEGGTVLDCHQELSSLWGVDTVVRF